MKMTTKQKRLVGALFLAITAPNETKTAECVRLAETLAVGMSEKAIEKCKIWASLAASKACEQFIAEKARLN